MKLYAIRDKETGQLEGLPSGVWSFMIFGHKCHAETEIRVFRDDNKFEVVTFREEPTEPCEWCDVNDGAWCATYDGRMIALDSEGSPETLLAKNWSFCPNCGRGLA